MIVVLKKKPRGGEMKIKIRVWMGVAAMLAAVVVWVWREANDPANRMLAGELASGDTY